LIVSTADRMMSSFQSRYMLDNEEETSK
jgi:hypothetical protein